MKKVILILIVILCGLLCSCNVIFEQEKDSKNKENEIHEVSFNFDTVEYKLSYDSLIYEAEYIKDSNYNYINVVVKAKDDYSFSKDVKVYVNEVESKDFILSTDLKTLTYKAKDPNWTPFY